MHPKVAIAVHFEISMLYWHIGKRINSDILNNKRAEYGKQIVAILSQQLTREYGRGWSKKQLHHCLYAVETFPDEKIFSELCRKLSWSHTKELIYIKVAEYLMILPPKELLKEKLQLAIEIAKNKLPDNG